MSLYVFISRRPDPTTDDGAEISEDEWYTLAARESDLRRPNAAELREESSPGSVQASDVAWQSPDGTLVWLSWYAGQIEVRNADQPTIARLVELAKDLSARVVSETGEVFDSQGVHAGFEPWSEFYEAPRKASVFRRLFGKADGT